MRLKNYTKYHVFPLELSFQKICSCQVIRKLLNYGPLMGGGGGRGGGVQGIEDGCEQVSWKTVL